jgi:TPR repeat protein
MYLPIAHTAGICYRNGIGVTKDDAKMVQLYTMAAARGHAEAQNSLGELHTEPLYGGSNN